MAAVRLEAITSADYLEREFRPRRAIALLRGFRPIAAGNISCARFALPNFRHAVVIVPPNNFVSSDTRLPP
jgi:hypothetical protein